VAAGDRVRPGDPLVELVDPGRLEVHAQIPTRHQATVAAHLADGGTLAAQGHLAGGRVPLTLTRLAGAIAPGSGGIAGILEPAADTGYLPVGQSLTVTLRLPPLPGTLRLPREALYGSDKVYRVDGGALEAVPVQVLGRVERPGGGDAVIVASDELADGDRVAATQLPNAIEGLPVRVLPGTGAGAEGP
jgi:multidrug efflux pump subunit AcrA (membrane-fusion protein)